MKKLLLIAAALAGMCMPAGHARDLVAYFSAQNHTKAVAERIAELLGADLYRIEAAEPYAANPYDDSDRIQREAYDGLRPAVANPPSQEWIDGYDRIFIGTPCWWHQPAMVVCTFLETYDLSRHTIVPFVTYGATTYLNETMQTLYRSTPNSAHIPETLPEDLDPDDITTPGRPDDAGIAMPGNAAGVESWLSRLGIAAVDELGADSSGDVRIHTVPGTIRVELADALGGNTVEIYDMQGALLHRMADSTAYTFSLRARSVYLCSVVYGADNRRMCSKLVL